MNIPENTKLPYAINLFSSEAMSNRETADALITDVLDNLFDSNGLMKFEQYSYYSYLLNIFAKVYYLKGFTAKSPAAFGDETNRFTATSEKQFNIYKGHGLEASNFICFEWHSEWSNNRLQSNATTRWSNVKLN